MSFFTNASQQQPIFANPLDSLFKTSNLSPVVLSHLRNVYAWLTLTLLATTLGVYLHITTYFFQGGILSTLLTFGMTLGISMSAPTKENQTMRYGMLLGLGLFQGITLGSLIEFILNYHPGVLITALTSTALVFVSFSAASFMNTSRRITVYLGGVLFSALSILSWLSLANLFFRIPALFSAELYLGLLLFCGYVVYDTQMLVARVEMGYKDVPGDCVKLFTDIVAVFVRIAILLVRQQDNKDKRRRG